MHDDGPAAPATNGGASMTDPMSAGSQPESMLVILNPAAGRGDPEERLGQVEEILTAAGVRYEVRATEGEGDAFTWARDAEGVDRVLALGGDGTVMEAMSGLIASGSSIPLAQVPSGTANVLALALGLPHDVREATELAVRGDSMPFDVGYLPDHDRYFVLAAG